MHKSPNLRYSCTNAKASTVASASGVLSRVAL
jgi:hypothetical protein